MPHIVWVVTLRSAGHGICAVPVLARAWSEAGRADGLDRAAAPNADRVAALEAEEPVRAEELLKTAFTGEDIHVVGVTFRPSIKTARVAAGIAGGVVATLGLLGLMLRRRADRRTGAA